MKKLTLIVIMSFCLCGSAFAGKNLVVAVPALAFVGDNGDFSGYSVEYLKAVAEVAGFKIELKMLPRAIFCISNKR